MINITFQVWTCFMWRGVEQTLWIYAHSLLVVMPLHVLLFSLIFVSFISRLIKFFFFSRSNKKIPIRWGTQKPKTSDPDRSFSEKLSCSPRHETGSTQGNPGLLEKQTCTEREREREFPFPQKVKPSKVPQTNNIIGWVSKVALKLDCRPGHFFILSKACKILLLLQ